MVAVDLRENYSLTRPDHSRAAALPALNSGGSDADNLTQSPPSPASTRVHITVGSTVFQATLYDNETVAAFKAMLPLTLNMIDLNANGKLSTSNSYTRMGKVDDPSGWLQHWARAA